MNDSSPQDTSPTKEQFLRDVLDGLTQPQKTLPCKYLYDERGSQLFERICAVEEYYPTRTELEIMQQSAEEMADCLGTDCIVVELGSGASVKTQILLNHLAQPAAYVPVDISKKHLAATARRMAERYPGLPIHPICADFTGSLTVSSLPPCGKKNVIYFPGSTIGNLSPTEATALLQRMAELSGRGGGLLIGFDLKKSAAILEPAYNDQAGVTSDFNLNILEHINRELEADFQKEAFRHRAYFNEEESRVEMHLISQSDQTIRISGTEFSIVQNETIHTENSYKYSMELFAAITNSAGFTLEKTWLDPKQYFCIQYLSTN